MDQNSEEKLQEKLVAIIQPNYIPWKGYFDIINRVDEFVFYDDVQYTKKDWRNRNRIKTPNGLIWLTIPIRTKNKLGININEVKVDGIFWKNKHLKSLQFNYKSAHCYDQVIDYLEGIYANINSKFLCEINYDFTKKISSFLGITTKFRCSSNFTLIQGRSERVVDLCQQIEATHILNGPSAKNHMNEQLFLDSGIKVSYMDYSNYPEYPQLYPPFIHEVSIVDLLFHTGKDASKYLKSFTANQKD